MSATAQSSAAAILAPLRRLGTLNHRFPVLQVTALVVAYLIGIATLPGLASWQSAKLILVVAALTGLAAAGQTLLVLMGGFDLSIAGMIVASALIVTQVRDTWGVSFPVALAIAIVGAALLGALAGQICHRLDVQPLVVTLAIGTIAVGLAQSQTPSGLSFGASAPPWLISLASPNSGTFGIDVPPLVVIWVGVAIVATVFIHRTRWGRELLATGANERAALYSLVRTRRVWTLAFAFSAVASALVGLAVAGFGGAITTGSGDPYLFQSVVAVIVGGTIFGGPGDYLRTCVGALLLTVVNIVLVGHGAGTAVAQMIFGATILIVVSMHGRERRIRDQI
jgi:ribose transport system permease protein